MNSSWTIQKLKEKVDLLAGYPFKSSLFTDDVHDIPLVKGENVQQGYIDWGKSKRWKTAEFDALQKFHLVSGDVVIAMDRPWVPAGLKYAWIRPNDPPALLVQRVSRLRAKNGLLQDYLRYVIGFRGFCEYLKKIVTGVNVPHISGEQILSFEFLLPPLPVQKKIAGILSAYDDLIENNRRRIQILEEMARNLYREWFVKFRFPIYRSDGTIERFHDPETDPMQDSALGLIPQGWEVKTAFDVIQVLSGGTPKTTVEAYWNGDIPFFTPTDANNATWTFTTEKSITDEGLNKCNSRLYPRETIFITARGTVGKLSMAQRPMAMNQSCYALVGKEPLTQVFTFLAMREAVSALQQQATGAIFDAIVVDTFKNIELVFPDSDKTIAFDSAVKPIILEVEKLALKEHNLKQTRDLLLPKLISGEIEIKGFAHEQ